MITNEAVQHPRAASDRLRDVDLRVTGPRVAVLDVLEGARAGHEHLTAADVADRVRGRAGTVSIQAVYDCLDVLTRVGLARRIEPAGHAARFEARVGDNHHHVVCRRCGLTADVDCVTGASACLTPADAAGFVVDEAEVTFWGLCPGCAGGTSAVAPTDLDRSAPARPDLD